jgi:UDP-N-acetylmuramate--alanine ligase
MVLPLPGEHNVENALAAGALAMSVGVNADQLRNAYASFKGVKRRFEFIVRNEDCVYIDDYAHHPSEIKAAIKATRQLYPDRKITAIFQPHLFSRTRDFMTDFAAELSKVDELILLDIYPAREEPLEGITSARLMEEITCPCHLLERDSVLKFVSVHMPEVLLTLGAGDIDRIVEPLKSILS